MYVIPRPTRCAVIDLGRPCQAKCSFCYYALQEGVPKWVDFDELKNQVDSAKLRGNTFIDLTGGEPTIMPRIEEYIDYIHSKEMKVCIITNGLIEPEKVKGLIEKVDLWRFSMHNMAEFHDKEVGFKNAREKQIYFISAVQNHIEVTKGYGFHVNMVLCKGTQYKLEEFASWLLTLKHFRQFSIINFLPHYEWGKAENAVKEIADLRYIESSLNNMIDILESNNVGVNIRYFPMCRIREDLRRVICNDLQVMFDPWEWDYGAFPKTMKFYTEFGENISNHNEEKGEPCCNCKIHKVCGGINKAMNRATEGKLVDPVLDGNNLSYPYEYRQYNTRTLMMPWRNM